MRPINNNMKNFIKNANLSTNPKTDKKVLDDILKAHEQSIINKPTTLASDIRKIIMKSKMTRLATTAAVIIIAVVGLWPGNNSNGKVYGMGDVSDLFRSAQTLHIKGYRWIYGDKKEFPDFSETKKAPIEIWVDVPKLRMRFISFQSYTKSNGEKHVDRSEHILNNLAQMSIDHTHKKVWYNKACRLDHRLRIRQILNEYASMVEEEHLKGYTCVGNEWIEGVDYSIWESQYLEAPSSGWVKLRCWLSPTTGYIGKLCQWWKRSENDDWQPSVTIEKIERDIEIPADVFTFQELEDYKHDGTPETASYSELGHGATYIGGFNFTEHVCFTLSDGSVIVGWKSYKEKNEKQEHLFETLEVGGDFPGLPIVLQELKLIPSVHRPAGLQERPTYIGHHLAYTVKDSRFTEWGLYVPTTKSPISLPRYVYKGYYRLGNKPDQPLIKHNPVWGTTLKADEFDEFVREAMAELSDDRKVPDYITYDFVMQLAEEIRESLVN